MEILYSNKNKLNMKYQKDCKARDRLNLNLQILTLSDYMYYVFMYMKSYIMHAL